MNTTAERAVRETPLLMCGEMVRKTLAGEKTKTRRVLKPQPLDCQPTGGTFAASWSEKTAEVYEHLHCPYGQPGERLWVKETWAPYDDDAKADRDLSGIGYRADKKWSDASPYSGNGEIKDGRWWPSIFMPRWASRLTLEIVSVSVERVQEITEEDAMAEGVEIPAVYAGRPGSPGPMVQSFASLWNQLNEARGFAWHTNPWVWVIEFRKL